MLDFGDEFVTKTYRVPWLIWILPPVMFLLIFCSTTSPIPL